MSIATFIIGESGTGKTASLRNLNPRDVLLIQPVRKPLPFRSAGWGVVPPHGKVDDEHCVYVQSNPSMICAAMRASTRPIIIVDDWQYVLTLLFMARRAENGYQKFSDIGGAGFDIINTATQLSDGVRVYLMAHTQTDEMGNVRIKTLGKMLDDKIVPEGMVTIVLRTAVENGRYMFRTHNSGTDTVKSPMGLFKEDLIENDLAAVDKSICDYYGIATETTTSN